MSQRKPSALPLGSLGIARAGLKSCERDVTWRGSREGRIGTRTSDPWNSVDAPTWKLENPARDGGRETTAPVFVLSVGFALVLPKTGPV